MMPRNPCKKCGKLTCYYCMSESNVCIKCSAKEKPEITVNKLTKKRKRNPTTTDKQTTSLNNP